jgi:hypothetical protein
MKMNQIISIHFGYSHKDTYLILDIYKMVGKYLMVVTNLLILLIYLLAIIYLYLYNTICFGILT